jgi:hypothetical protein
VSNGGFHVSRDGKVFYYYTCDNCLETLKLNCLKQAALPAGIPQAGPGDKRVQLK